MVDNAELNVLLYICDKLTAHHIFNGRKFTKKKTMYARVGSIFYLAPQVTTPLLNWSSMYNPDSVNHISVINDIFSRYPGVDSKDLKSSGQIYEEKK